MNRKSLIVLALALSVAALPAVADQPYMLQAHKWGAAQTAAVEAAGGTVIYGHGASGLGAVTSSNPDFLEQVMASGAFQQGAADQVVQWNDPEMTEEATSASVTPGDEFFYPIQWHLPAVEAPGAWNAGCDGTGARVAILDGGIYDIHPDLSNNLDKACSVSFVPGQPYNNDTGTFWHGTHVAGIVAGADNGFGVLGVAPGATLMGVKVLHSGSGSFGQVIGGILYASDPAAFGLGNCQRADIINMSLGATFFRSGFQQLIGAMAKAVNFAASKGVLVISAAGNNGLDLGQSADITSLPAESGSGLAISATGPIGFALGATNFDNPASYSNYGEGTVFVAATGGDFVLPGSDVCTVGPVTQFCWVFDLVFSTCRGTSTPPTFSFCWSAGTSMAAPTAAGVAALIVGDNPGISLGALKAKLKNTATDSGPNGHDEFYGHGFVNARQACTQ